MNINKLKSDPRMPKHVAFIMDGNGRWAKKRGMPRTFGHKVGFQTMRSLIDFCMELGIKNVSFYCFSKENFKRPEKEVNYLMEIFNEMIDEFKEKYLSKDIKIVISGDMDDERIPEEIRTKAKELIELTKDKSGFVINPCIAYGGRDEIIKVVNELIQEGVKAVDVDMFEQHLYTKGLYPVDFIIRTSGECRLSGFLTWQSTYSEWYFTKTYWPSFNKQKFVKALKIYMKRNRRFGAV